MSKPSHKVVTKPNKVSFCDTVEPHKNMSRMLFCVNVRSPPVLNGKGCHGRTEGQEVPQEKKLLQADAGTDGGSDRPILAPQRFIRSMTLTCISLIYT